MKHNKTAKILTAFIAIYGLMNATGLCANVPVPNNQPKWDNFNINNVFVESSAAPIKQTPQKTENKVLPAKQTVQFQENKLQTEQQKPTFSQPLSIETMPLKSLPASNTIETTEQSAVTMTPDKADALTDLRNNAKLLYNANKPEEALRVYLQIPDAQKISEDWLYLANIAQDNQKEMDAVFYLKKAIQADENNFKAHYNLGNLYLADDKINMALDEYNKAIKAKKDFSYAYFNKGCAYLKKKSWFNAKYEFGMAIKNNPNEPAFFYNLAYTYKMMNKTKKAEDALAIYEELMQK